MDRRGFLGALGVLAARPAWSAGRVGGARYVTTAGRLGAGYALYGLDGGGDLVFETKLPGRGHGIAVRPGGAVAVVFARRPGWFAIPFSLDDGAPHGRLAPPEGRHFYGHGAYSSDGALLFSTENAYETGEGRIGVWDVARGYRRVGEFASGGIGPHEAILVDGLLAVANGGIRTHPDFDRLKLNVPDMAPNLSFIDPGSGRLIEQIELRDMRMNSTRHLAARGDGLIALAMQWQGALERHPPLLALLRRGARPILCAGPDQAAMRGYGGAVAFSGDGREVAVTSPKGGRMQIFDAETGAHLRNLTAEDVCGVARAQSGFLASAGTGRLYRIPGPAETRARADLVWDNHITAL